MRRDVKSLNALILALAISFACSLRRARERHDHERRGQPTMQKVDALATRAPSPDERKTIDAAQFAMLGSGNVRSFHTGYDALFRAHQPVYVTADSLLYAWHSSYDAILIAIERASIAPRLDEMLGELRSALESCGGPAVLRADLDEYLAVALSLLRGHLEPPVAGGDARAIADIVEQATRASGNQMKLFGGVRSFDFSMLKPRGHYVEAGLESYFRAMSWLGRVDLRLATQPKAGAPWAVDRRALDDALLLESLFTGRARAAWDAIDRAFIALVGPRDSMSLPELATVRRALPADLVRASDSELVATLRGPASAHIHTQWVDSESRLLSFVLLGQRYALDSHVLSRVLYGELADDNGRQTLRMMPTPADIGYAVFDNRAARQLLEPEVAAWGAPYAIALEAAHRDASAASELTTGSLYHRWLGALRTLSPDRDRDAGLPAPFVSDAWARRMLNTQLASWAELRHDNLLYAEPTDTMRETCEYPDGYIDPYPAFYGAMESLATQGKAMVAALPPEPPPAPDLLPFFDAMGATMAKLRHIAERERANQPLEAADLDFLNHMVSLDGKQSGCTTVYEAAGWYGHLYYDRSHALEHEPVIVDVHTQVTDEDGNALGRVLHVATALPRMMIVTVAHDGGQHMQTYRGFVSTYQETITDRFQRITDKEWRDELWQQPPMVLPWLRDIVAP